MTSLPLELWWSIWDLLPTLVLWPLRGVNSSWRDGLWPLLSRRPLRAPNQESAAEFLRRGATNLCLALPARSLISAPAVHQLTIAGSDSQVPLVLQGTYQEVTLEKLFFEKLDGTVTHLVLRNCQFQNQVLSQVERLTLFYDTQHRELDGHGKKALIYENRYNIYYSHFQHLEIISDCWQNFHCFQDIGRLVLHFIHAPVYGMSLQQVGEVIIDGEIVVCLEGESIHSWTIEYFPLGWLSTNVLHCPDIKWSKVDSELLREVHTENLENCAGIFPHVHTVVTKVSYSEHPSFPAATFRSSVLKI